MNSVPTTTRRPRPPPAVGRTPASRSRKRPWGRCWSGPCAWPTTSPRHHRRLRRDPAAGGDWPDDPQHLGRPGRLGGLPGSAGRCAGAAARRAAQGPRGVRLRAWVAGRGRAAERPRLPGRGVGVARSRCTEVGDASRSATGWPGWRGCGPRHGHTVGGAIRVRRSGHALDSWSIGHAAIGGAGGRTEDGRSARCWWGCPAGSRGWKSVSFFSVATPV